MWRIRRAEVEDEAAVTELWRAAGLSVPEDPQWVGLIAGSAARVLVAEAGGSVAGAVVASFDGWRARIYHVAVAPARRRRGLGRALVEEAELHLAGEGAQRVRLIVGDGDEAALALAASAGYVRQRGAQLVKVLTVDLQTPEREVRWTLATGFRMPVLDRHELEQARRRFLRGIRTLHRS